MKAVYQAVTSSAHRDLLIAAAVQGALAFVLIGA